MIEYSDIKVRAGLEATSARRDGRDQHDRRDDRRARRVQVADMLPSQFMYYSILVYLLY